MSGLCMLAAQRNKLTEAKSRYEMCLPTQNKVLGAFVVSAFDIDTLMEMKTAAVADSAIQELIVAGHWPGATASGVASVAKGWLC